MDSIQILLILALVSATVGYGYDDDGNSEPSNTWRRDGEETHTEPQVGLGAQGGFKVQGNLGTDWNKGGLFSAIKSQATGLPFLNIAEKIKQHIGEKVQETAGFIKGISEFIEKNVGQKKPVNGGLDVEISKNRDTGKSSWLDFEGSKSDISNKYDSEASTNSDNGNLGLGWKWDSNVDFLGKSTHRYKRSVDFLRNGVMNGQPNRGMPEFSGNGFPRITGFSGPWGGMNENGQKGFPQFPDFKNQKGLNGFPQFPGIPGDKNQKGFPQIPGPWGGKNQNDFKGFPQIPGFNGDMKNMGFPQFPGLTGDKKSGFSFGKPPNGMPNFPRNKKQGTQ